MTKLEAKTKEQQDYIAALVEEESCDGDVKVCEDGIDYTVDQCFGVGISFDTMAEIVDSLRNELVSEDLDEAAKADAMIERPDDTEVGYDLNRYGGFIAGAQWREEQIIKRLCNHANIDQMAEKFEDKYKPPKVLDTEYYKRGIYDTIKIIKEDLV